MPKQLCKKDPDQRIWKALSESTVDELIGVLDIPSSKDLGNKKEEPKDGEFRRLMLKSPIELKYLYDICISYLAFFFRFDQTPQGLRLLKLQPLSCLSVKIFEEYGAKVGNTIDAIRDFPCVLEAFFKDYSLNIAILEYFLRRPGYRDMIRSYLRFHYILPIRIMEAKLDLERFIDSRSLEAQCVAMKLDRLINQQRELDGAVLSDPRLVTSIPSFLVSDMYPYLDAQMQKFFGACRELKGIASNLHADCEQRERGLVASGKGAAAASRFSIRERLG